MKIARQFKRKHVQQNNEHKNLYEHYTSKEDRLDEIVEFFKGIVETGPKFTYIDDRHTQKESFLSKEIKVITEAEKIWILLQVKNDRKLPKDELYEYLDQMAYPKLDLKM